MRKILPTTLICLLLITLFTYPISVNANSKNTEYSIALAADEVITYDGVPFICPGGTKVLTASNAPVNASFQWYKNATIITGSKSDTYTVTETGEYSVIVTAEGVSRTYPKVRIEIVPIPVAKFTHLVSGDCSANRQFFTNESVGDSLTYSWDFGDPNSGANNINDGAYGKHYFIGTTGNDSQTFTVTLTATNKAGCSNSSSQTVTLKQSPNANLLANDLPAEAFRDAFYFKDCSNRPATFTFKNVSNTNNILYNIDWGDNDPLQPNYRNASFTEQTHTYKPGKIYTLSYTVTGANGCSNNRVYRIMAGGSPAVEFIGIPNNSINTNEELSISVAGSENNTIGTFYRVDYSDGIVQRPQLPLTAVNRTFLRSSFGATTIINNIVYRNAYSAFIRAYNVCGESPRNYTGPIYVSDKQTARFKINQESICLKESADISYTDSIGYSVTKQGVGYKNRLIWQITPNRGYEILDGNLGSDNNTTDPFKWTTGSINLKLKFVENGIYTIKLITGTANLVETSSSTQIEVKALPIVNKPDDRNLCNGETCDQVKFTGSIPNTIYKWTNTNSLIGLSESGTGDISAFFPVNNSNEPLIATISVTPYSNDCIGKSESFTITVSPTLQKPSARSTVNYCLGSPTTPLSATAMAGNVLKWYDNESLVNGSSVAPDPATSKADTTYYYVTQINANGCESPASKIEVIVNPEIVNNVITGNQSLCYNTEADPLTQASDYATGGNNTFRFQWQSSSDGVTWSNISGATKGTFSPGKLTDTKKYRRRVSSGSCEDFSNIITIKVQNSITDFEIADDQQIVEPRRVPLEIVGQRAQGGDGTQSYQWETSSGNDAWNLIIGATTQNYQPPALLETASFRRITKSGICSVTSSAVTITVYNGIKNTFTPNGDGINDTWDISGFAVVPNTKVKVYNRLGQLVFDGQNESTWNGEFQGSKLPMGVYYYLITQNDKKPIKGWVSIIY